MTAFLFALLVAVVLGGGLVVLFRENRRRFRIALGVLVAGGVAVAVYLSLHGLPGTRDGGAPVAVTEARLTVVAGSYRLAGNLRNDSQALAVSAVPIHLQVNDCATTPCRRLLDATQLLRLSVPPGEHRAFLLTFPAPPGTARAGAGMDWSATTGTPATHMPVPR